MNTLFGTDGIRGRANSEPMTVETITQVAKALGQKICSDKTAGKPRVVIGKDTRISSYMFEFAATAGLCSIGCDALLVGPVPTPAVAHLVKSFAADAGIVVSASHNVFSDNGIKIFNNQGYKIGSSDESMIESLVAAAPISASYLEPECVGKATRLVDAVGRYVEFAKASIQNQSLQGLKIVVDCANGAASHLAEGVFKELGADVIVIYNEPDGLNINQGCGALHPEAMQAAVKANSAHAGLALDGDADRVIMADESGSLVTGDKLLYILAKHALNSGNMKSKVVVGTVLSNLGLELALKALGITLERADVGDQYVLARMLQKQASFGGENSGHLILSEYATTGDGIISSLNILNIMAKTGNSLSVLASPVKDLPQIMINLPVPDKRPLEDLSILNNAIVSAEAELGSKGRIVVRYSGTENLLRIFVEGQETTKITGIAKKLESAAKAEFMSDKNG